MKKWVKGLLLASIIICTPTIIAYQMGYQYKIPSYTAKVVSDNTSFNNYERKVSFSIAFDDADKQENTESLLKKVNGSSLILKESKTADAHSVAFTMNVEGEEFSGEQLYTNNNLIFKSPMYHRYITFFETDFTEEKSVNLTYLKNNVLSFLDSTASSWKLYRDKGANEKGVKTIEIKGQNKEVEKVLVSLTNNIGKGVPYESILLNQELVTNRLLKKSSSENEVVNKFPDKLKAIEHSIESVLNYSQVTDSEISIKINKDKVIKEGNAIISLTYTNPDTKKEIPFKLYVDISTWNVGKAKYKEIDIDPTNSIPYKKMTDDIDFFGNENLKEEVNPTEDNSHVQQSITESSQQGLIENTTTLEALGDDFKVIKEEDKKE